MILCGKNSTALLPKPPHQEYYWWVGTPCRFIWPTWAHGWVTHLFLQRLSRQHLGVFTQDIVTGYKPIIKTEEMSNTTSINFGWRETSIYRIYRSFQKNPSFPVIKSELIITVILIWHERSISATCQLRWFKALIGGMKSVALGLITTQSSWIKVTWESWDSRSRLVKSPSIFPRTCFSISHLKSKSVKNIRNEKVPTTQIFAFLLKFSEIAVILNQ